MGTMFTKNSPGLVEWRTQRAKRKRIRQTHRQPPGVVSSDTTQATVNSHHVEVHLCQITQNESEAHMMVPSDGMETQKSSPDGAETQSLLSTSGSAEVTPGILVAEKASKVADPSGDTMIGTEVESTGLSLQCEGEVTPKARKVHVLRQDFGDSSEISKASAPESPLRSSTVPEEDTALEVNVAVSPVVLEGESWKTKEEHHSSLNSSGEDEPATNDQKATNGMDLETGMEKAVGPTEHNTIVQGQADDVYSGETVGMAGAHPSLGSAETSDSSGQK